MLIPENKRSKKKKIPGAPGWGTLPKECWGRLNTTIDGLHVEGAIETIPGNYLNFYQNIYEVIREGKPLDVKPEESREVIRLIEAAYESNRTRKSVKLKA